MKNKALVLAFLILFSASFAFSYTYVKSLAITNYSISPGEPVQASQPFTVSNKVYTTEETIADYNVNFPNFSFETGDFTDWNGTTTIQIFVSGSPAGGGSFSVANAPAYATDGIYTNKFTITQGFVSCGGQSFNVYAKRTNQVVYSGDQVCFDVRRDTASTYVSSFAPIIGFYNDSNNLLAFNTTPDSLNYSTYNLAAGNRLCYIIPTSTSSDGNKLIIGGFGNNGNCFSTFSDIFHFDNFKITPKITANQYLTNATCDHNFNTLSINHMVFNSSTQKYEADYNAMGSSTTLAYDLNCSKATYTSARKTGTVQFIRFLDDFLIYTPISNSSNYTLDANLLKINPSIESNDVIFSLENLLSSSETVPIKLTNSLQDGKRYFIYTAT